MSDLKVWLLALLLALPLSARAQNDAAKAEMESALKDAKAASVRGPADVKLLDQGQLKLAAGYTFVPVPAAGKLLRAMGNSTGNDLVGLVFMPQYPDSFVVVSYEKSGYIKDDDARDWKSDEMLDNLKSGTEAGNAERRSRGIPEMDVLGWIERPTYDEKTHRLIWSVSTRDKGAPADAAQGVNYNTYALGREGYISMNLVTDAKSVEAQKPIAAQLLGALEFDSGKRYADYNSSTDKVAEYGLAALVGGIAAKKLGLFAIAAAFVLKFIKVFVLGAFAALAGVRKWFTRKKHAPLADDAAPGKVYSAPGPSDPFARLPPKADPFPPTQPLPVDPFPPTQPLPAQPFPATRPLDGVPPAAPVGKPPGTSNT